MVRPALYAVGIALLLAGCSDPKDPKTWIKKLRDPEHATEAVRQLQKLGKLEAVEPLCKLYKDFESPVILKAIISFKDKVGPGATDPAARAARKVMVATLIDTLGSFTEDKYHNATLAAGTLAHIKATEAVPALMKVLSRPMAIKSRANLAKLAAIEALARLGDRRAVPALIKVLLTPPERQDFMLNKKAAEALGIIGDPSAVPALIRGLFLASTIQGTSYPMARVALVRIGEPAIGPLIKAMRGEDPDINAMAKELSFRPGVVLNKTAIVLGDIRSPKAIPPLLEELSRADLAKDTHVAGIIEALGKIGDPKPLPELHKLLNNKKAHFKLRMQVCQALTVIGARASVPILLDVAEHGYIQKTYTDLREAAAMAYGRIVGKGAEAGVAKLKSFLADESLKGYKRTLDTFKEALDRAKLAVTCKDDPVCYGKHINDSKLTLAQREKAGIMIGVLPDGRKALDALIQALPVREPILRLFYLEAAKRIGKASDTKLVALLEKLAAKDSKRKVKFLGADLASADKIALAVIKRQK